VFGQLLFVMSTATLSNIVLLLTEMLALRLIAGDAVVSWGVGVTENRGFKVLNQVLVLMGQKLAALLHTMDASALLVRHRSFLLLCELVLFVESLKVHPSETGLEVKGMLEVAVWLTSSSVVANNFLRWSRLLLWLLRLPGNCIV